MSTLCTAQLARTSLRWLHAALSQVTTRRRSAPATARSSGRRGTSSHVRRAAPHGELKQGEDTLRQVSSFVSGVTGRVCIAIRAARGHEVGHLDTRTPIESRHRVSRSAAKLESHSAPKAARTEGLLLASGEASPPRRHDAVHAEAACAFSRCAQTQCASLACLKCGPKATERVDNVLRSTPRYGDLHT